MTVPDVSMHRVSDGSLSVMHLTGCAGAHVNDRTFDQHITELCCKSEMSHEIDPWSRMFLKEN